MAEEKTPQVAPADPTELARVFAEIALRSKHLVETRMADAASGEGGGEGDDLGVGKAFTALAARLMSDPFRLAETSLRMWHDYFALWQATMRKAAGENAPAVAEPAKSDNRFRGDLWQSNW